MRTKKTNYILVCTLLITPVFYPAELYVMEYFKNICVNDRYTNWLRLSRYFRHNNIIRKQMYFFFQAEVNLLEHILILIIKICRGSIIRWYNYPKSNIFILKIWVIGGQTITPCLCMEATVMIILYRFRTILYESSWRKLESPLQQLRRL